MARLVSGRIVLVDDNHEFINMLAERLRSAGFLSVETYYDPAIALALLSGGCKPAVVISDFDMPTMNGPEFLSLVNQAHAPFTGIILTGAPQAAQHTSSQFDIITKDNDCFLALVPRILNGLAAADS